MTPKIIAEATEEPLTIEECRAHLEAQVYGDSDVDPADDTMIEGLLGAAREHCEAFLGLSLAIRTLEIALDDFPDDAAGIDLPLGPVRSIVSFVYGVGSDDFFIDGDYLLNDYVSPNQVGPVATTWPSITASTNIVKVQYQAGYGEDSDGDKPLPKLLRVAILLALGALYKDRENPDMSGADAVMRPMRVRLGMA